jgi:hypothetical protein
MGRAGYSWRNCRFISHAQRGRYSPAQGWNRKCYIWQSKFRYLRWNQRFQSLGLRRHEQPWFMLWLCGCMLEVCRPEQNGRRRARPKPGEQRSLSPALPANRECLFLIGPINLPGESIIKQLHSRPAARLPYLLPRFSGMQTYNCDGTAYLRLEGYQCPLELDAARGQCRKKQLSHRRSRLNLEGRLLPTQSFQGECELAG